MAYAKKNKKDAGEKNEDEKILEDARTYLKECVEEEEAERAKMLDDLKFASLDQWPHEIRSKREDVNQDGGPRPCLTIDKLNQYIVQVVNDMRQGKPGINVRPQDDGADVETAKILKGLIRNIEDQSKADIAYATAGESAAKIGLGYFRITTEYVDEESFDQDLFIRPVPNTFSVYLGKHLMPDGSDAERGYITEQMPIEKFKETYPQAKFAKDDFADLDTTLMGYWRSEETITVCEEFCFKREQEELLFLEDGTTMSAADYAKWPEETMGPKPAVTDRRTTMRKHLKWCKITGVEVLEKRDLPGQFIPIIEVVGREAWIEGKRSMWGLVRPAKDSLRMYNYWASMVTERMALEPKQPYIGAKGQFENLEAQWQKANTSNRPYLEYNAIDIQGTVVPAPQRVGPHPVEAALLNQMQVIEHDVQTSLGMFKAATGESESQQSGRAILALQRESDTGTYHFGANLGQSIRHAGRILVDLIPHYYDTKRIVRILGEDGEVQTATLDPNLQQPFQQTPQGPVFNPSMGKYDVSISVGPSYNTKRMEAQAIFVEMAKGAADPISAAVLRYLTMRNSDVPGTEEAVQMLRATIPPQVLQAVAGNEQIPPVAKAIIAQKDMQLQQVAQELQQEQAGGKAEMAKVQSDHDAKMKTLQLEAQVEAEKARLAREQAERDFALERYKVEEQIKLEKLKCTNEQEREEDRFALERDKHEREAEMERTERAKDEQAEVAPQFAQVMGDALKMFVQALAQMQESQTKQTALLAEALKNPAPRTVSMRTASGTQATATIQ